MTYVLLQWPSPGALGYRGLGCAKGSSRQSGDGVFIYILYVVYIFGTVARGHVARYIVRTGGRVGGREAREWEEEARHWLDLLFITDRKLSEVWVNFHYDGQSGCQKIGRSFIFV